jgi:hypothetical protein
MDETLDVTVIDVPCPGCGGLTLTDCEAGTRTRLPVTTRCARPEHHCSE